MKNKKIWLTLGATVMITSPVIMAVSCGAEQVTAEDMTFDEYINTIKITPSSTSSLSISEIDEYYNSIDGQDGQITIDSQAKANEIKNGLGITGDFNIGTLPKGYSIVASATRSALEEGRKREYSLAVVVKGTQESETHTFSARVYSRNEYETILVDFDTYTDTVSFRAPEVARKTYQHLDAFVDNNPGEVTITEQDQADVFKDELGLDMFEIGNKPESYRMTLVLSKVTPIPNANKRYAITLNIRGLTSTEFFTKTVYIRSTNIFGEEAIADAEKVAAVKEAFGTPTSANNKTIAQLDAAKLASITSTELTQDVLSSIGVTATIPSSTNGVLFAYSITKGLMQNNQKVPYTFRIHLKLNDAEDMIVTEILSSDNYVAPVTDAEAVANLKAEIGTPVASNTKTISEIESLPTSGNYTHTQFEMFGITANVPADRNGVSLTYQVLGGEKVHNQKVNYTVRLILTKNGTSDFIAISLQSSNVYISPQADQNTVDALKEAIGTITSANNKTHEQLDAVATSGSYSAALFTSLGLTGTIPSNLNGATLTYALERAPRNPQQPVDYGFNLYITKGNATAVIIVHIQSSNPYYPPVIGDTEEEQKVNAEKANFDSIYGSAYNEDAISVLPQDGDWYFTTNGIFTREYIEADEDVSADYAVKALDEYTVELTVTFSLWGDFEKTVTATSVVIITYRMIQADVEVMNEIDRIEAQAEAGLENTYPNAATTLPSQVTTKFTNFNQFTSSITGNSKFKYNFRFDYKNDATGEIDLEIVVTKIGFNGSANEAYITLRGFKTA